MYAEVDTGQNELTNAEVGLMYDEGDAKTLVEVQHSYAALLQGDFIDKEMYVLAAAMFTKDTGNAVYMPNYLRVGTVWVDCYDVLEAQVGDETRSLSMLETEQEGFQEAKATTKPTTQLGGTTRSTAQVGGTTRSPPLRETEQEGSQEAKATRRLNTQLGARQDPPHGWGT